MIIVIAKAVLLNRRALHFCNLYRKVCRRNGRAGKSVAEKYCRKLIFRTVHTRLSSLKRYSKNEALNYLPRATLPSCLSHRFLSISDLRRRVITSVRRRRRQQRRYATTIGSIPRPRPSDGSMYQPTFINAVGSGEA